MMLFGLAAAAAAAAAHPAQLHTYTDWIVGCDNVHACQANALEPDGDNEGYLNLTVDRKAGPSARAALDVPLPDKNSAGDRFTLKVDGKPAITFTVPAKDSTTLRLTGALLAALRNGSRAALFDADGKKTGEVSLAGLAASLRYMDDQQGRVDTVGALVATGAKPDTTAPPAPAPPTIVMPQTSPKPPHTLSVAAATKLIGRGAAVCEYANGKVEPRAYRLDDAHSLVLIDNPCGNGAYNYFTSVFVLDEAGMARDALFDEPPGMEGSSKDGEGELTNGDWDPKSHRLGSFEKGRGLGDCGSTESYVWDGARFRLVEQTAMNECRGSVDYIRTWTARVGR